MASHEQERRRRRLETEVEEARSPSPSAAAAPARQAEAGQPPSVAQQATILVSGLSDAERAALLEALLRQAPAEQPAWRVAQGTSASPSVGPTGAQGQQEPGPSWPQTAATTAGGGTTGGATETGTATSPPAYAGMGPTAATGAGFVPGSAGSPPGLGRGGCFPAAGFTGQNMFGQGPFVNGMGAEPSFPPYPDAGVGFPFPPMPNKPPLPDTRLLGKPPSFEGDEAQYREWRFTMRAYSAVLSSDLARLMDQAEAEPLPLNNNQLSMEHRQLSETLYYVLAMLLKGRALRLLMSVGQGQGLEGWRTLVRHFEPESSRRLLGFLSAILNPELGINLPPAQTP